MPAGLPKGSQNGPESFPEFPRTSEKVMHGVQGPQRGPIGPPKGSPVGTRKGPYKECRGPKEDPEEAQWVETGRSRDHRTKRSPWAPQRAPKGPQGVFKGGIRRETKWAPYGAPIRGQKAGSA